VTSKPKKGGGCDCSPMEMLPLFEAGAPDEPCCGPPAGPPASIDERPGYTICPFVEGFVSTPAGKVPRIKTDLQREDRLGTLGARLGVARDNYTVAPGLYAVGQPDAAAPVLVTANYKLSFDMLRRHLGGVAAWLLVLDTRGINVWCAAGKGTFGTTEIVHRVRSVHLEKVVGHRTLVLPQLGAPGVSSQRVKRACGFEVVWGPIRARDLPAFLSAGNKADEAMRSVTFTLKERLELVPVEFYLLRRPFVWMVLAIFLLSGIGRHLFSPSAAIERGLAATALSIVGIAVGCGLVPLLLPWVPGRAFAFKGGLVGLVVSTGVVIAFSPVAQLAFWPGVALVLFASAVSSYLAMNFTGTTPFTSPSGVEKEMRMAIPIQLASVVVAAGLWVGTAF
jgi:hypothetical protein